MCIREWGAKTSAWGKAVFRGASSGWSSREIALADGVAAEGDELSIAKPTSMLETMYWWPVACTGPTKPSHFQCHSQFPTQGAFAAQPPCDLVFLGDDLHHGVRKGRGKKITLKPFGPDSELLRVILSMGGKSGKRRILARGFPTRFAPVGSVFGLLKA